MASKDKDHGTVSPGLSPASQRFNSAMAPPAAWSGASGMMAGFAPDSVSVQRSTPGMLGPLAVDRMLGEAPAPAAAAAAQQGRQQSAAAAANTFTMPKKSSLNFLVQVLQEFIALYGPTLILLENLHDFDTWSWQLLLKVSELLTGDCLVLATTRPNDLTPQSAGPANYTSAAAHSRAALYHKVSVMYQHLLKQPSTERLVLEPFNVLQTRALMQVRLNGCLTACVSLGPSLASSVTLGVHCLAMVCFSDVAPPIHRSLSG